MNLFRKTMILAALGCCFSAQLMGANVIKRSSKKRVVMIDEGSNSGFNRGARVCFYRDDRKKGCGRVGKAKADKAIVRVKSKIIKSIKKGMTAKLVDEKGVAISESSGSSEYTLALRPLYVGSIMTPATYNTVTYSASSNADTNWESKETRSSAIFGFGLEVEYLFGSSSGIAFGVKYRPYCKLDFTCVSISDTDYSAENGSLYVQSEQSAESIGVYLDYVYMIKLSKGSSLNLGGGLDFDMSSVSLSSKQLDDNSDANNPVASASSSLSVISLRINPSYVVFFDPIGITIGLPILIPLTTTGASFSGEVTDESAAARVTDPVADLEASIDHKNGSVGLDLVLGIFFGF